ncbi:MAG: HDIG domain-containing protein [Bacteroidota bacterium]|nr:HDIG domain-containing protein [Bacteroidota bacterium]
MLKRFSYLFQALTERDSLSAKWVVFFGFVVAVALMFPQGLSVESDHAVGTVWTEADLYAPFAFPIYKDVHDYERERELSANKVYKVFEENQDVAEVQIDSLQRFFDLLQKIIDRRPSDAKDIDLALSNFPLQFRDSEWKTLWILRNVEQQRGKLSKYSFDKLRRDVLLVVNGIYLQGILDVRKSQLKPDEVIAKRKKTIEQIVPVNRFLDREELGKVVQQTFIAGFNGENDTVSIALKIALSFLTPNIIYQKEQTDREIQFAVDLVPRTEGAVSEGERIISKHDRVTPEIKLKLDSMRKAKEERGAGINTYITFAGKMLHIFSITWLLVMYFYLFRKRIYHDNGRLLLIFSLFLAVAFVAYLSVIVPSSFPLRFIIIVPVLSMLLGIIFDSRVAFYGTVVSSLLVAGVRGNDYGIALASLVAGSFAIYTARDIKKRTQIFRSIVYIFLGYAIVIVAFGLERYETFDTVLNQLVVASFNAIFSPIITYGVLIFFERFLKVSTELTLVDLSDLNHPILKELAHKAPGTFHHSVSVATLAASAAEAIGANATLARVGGLYHDIGKMANSELFVENQLGTENKHRVLSPRKSARVIAAHVDDGIELARKKNLPESIINFIPMHHGTMHIGFFYEKALRQKKNKNEVNESDFRYPGPKPNTKETAILLLADGVEASTRAIEDPTAEKIEANIESLIKLRLLEGELDESTLNMRDLSRIKESFLKILIGVHHSRLQYPEIEPQNNSAVKELEKPAPSKTKRSTPAKAAPDKRLQRTIENIDQ